MVLGDSGCRCCVRIAVQGSTPLDKWLPAFFLSGITDKKSPMLEQPLDRFIHIQIKKAMQDMARELKLLCANITRT